MLDNTSGLINSSPKFISSQFPNLQGSQLQRHSFSAFDADGDSLVYRLVTPLDGGDARNGLPTTACAQPVVGFTPSQFQLNAATGEVSTAPFSLVVGNFVIAVKVEEYRRIASAWTFIGSTTRDITYLVSPGGNTAPVFTAQQVGTTAQPFEKAILVNPGRTVSVLLDARDDDTGQTLSFGSDATTTVPGVSLQTVSATQARLTWQVPTNLPTGRYYLPVSVTDNGCPTISSEDRVITFLVTSQVLATHTEQRPILPAYPTPFREQVSFQLSQKGSQKITVLDGLGRTVANLTSRPDGSVTWQPGPTLPAGLYIARSANGQQLRLLRE
ncbi:hypothetical protein DNI29_05040 [Hymenobacter sediminis]|uniref:hypothetical protein n=1 Tax=Hymenobacter sediminis TaxID=2218621 RepID=UPI000DA68913|nr:hypothetical protein [Hymenobacter sediminis]RPD50164.1 hypothetical protein DNI29_05040 [Hymenobacter sediminis]